MYYTKRDHKKSRKVTDVTSISVKNGTMEIVRDSGYEPRCYFLINNKDRKIDAPPHALKRVKYVIVNK